MDEALKKSGDWPNIAITPGTRRHAATGEPVEQPENTRIGHPRGACRPDGSDCEHEPADVENRPQDGSECDTREQLEADIDREFEENYKGTNAERHYTRELIIGWLDRQAAITRRETRQSWQDAPNVLDRTNLQTIAELTAERDSLREKNSNQRRQLSELQDAIHSRNEGELKRQWKQQVEELEVDVQRLAEAAYSQRLVAMEQADKAQELTAERDDLRSRLKTQADSFQKLERDNAKLRDTLARVRELVGDAE